MTRFIKRLGALVFKPPPEPKYPKAWNADLTWPCHICGEVRPDLNISVHAFRRDMDGVPYTENIRYCNDNANCMRLAREGKTT